MIDLLTEVEDKTAAGGERKNSGETNRPRASPQRLLISAGHGTQVDDVNGDEEDGSDEAIIPAGYSTCQMKSGLLTYLKR